LGAIETTAHADPPRELDSSIHPGLSAVITHALAKDPAARFQSCGELLDALKNYRDVISPETTVRMDPARPPSVAAQAVTAAGHPTAVANTPAHLPAPSDAPAARPAFAGMQYQEPPKKRGTVLLTFILLGIIGYTSYRIGPQVKEVWRRMHEPDGAPPLIQKIVPKTTGLSKETPDINSDAAPESAPAQAVAEPPAPKTSPPPTQPVATVPPASTLSKSPATQKPAAPAESLAAAALKRRLDSDLASLSMADRVKLRVSGNTLTLSGKLIPKDYAELLTHLHNLPAGVHVVDEIQNTVVEGAAPAAAAKDNGWAWIRSTPAGAQISVDGKDTGLRTPARVEMPPGDHEILLTLRGFSDVHRTILVHSSENLAFTEILEEQ
jgi:hypothetical protein